MDSVSLQPFNFQLQVRLQYNEKSPESEVFSISELFYKILVGCPHAPRVCKFWSDALRDRLRLKGEVSSPSFACFAKFFLSGWTVPNRRSSMMPCPDNWTCLPDLTSVTQELIGFQPMILREPLVEVFPFFSKLPFAGKCQLVGSYNDTYVFQSYENFKEFKVAPKLASPDTWYSIFLKDIKIRFLEKRYTFISEKKMIFLFNQDRHCIFHNLISVDLTDGTWNSKEIKDPAFWPALIHNLLLLRYHVLDINSDKIIPKDVEYLSHYGSTFYYTTFTGRGFGSGFFNEEKQFITNWFIDQISPNDALCNDQYVVALKGKNGISFYDTQGYFQGHLPIYGGKPTRMHLMENIFVYTGLKNDTLIFWDIPQKNCICEMAINHLICDIKSTEEALVILIEKKERFEKKAYQIVKFDLKQLKCHSVTKKQ